MFHELQSPYLEEASKCPRYDYCESKINEFIQKVDNEIFYTANKYDSEGFTKFVDTIKKEIEVTFKVDERKFKNSQRNFYVNPWITPGIISSITKKHL